MRLVRASFDLQTGAAGTGRRNLLLFRALLREFYLAERLAFLLFRSPPALSGKLSNQSKMRKQFQPYFSLLLEFRCDSSSISHDHHIVQMKCSVMPLRARATSNPSSPTVENDRMRKRNCEHSLSQGGLIRA